MESVPLSAFLTVALLLFCIGLYGALTKKNPILILISIELMLNAANINFVTFSKYGVFPNITGQVFSLFIMAVAAAEIAVGIAILITLFRNKKTIALDEIFPEKQE